jgi:hypothetical protein
MDKIVVMYRVTKGGKTTEIGPFEVKAKSLASSPMGHLGKLHSEGKKDVLKAMVAP